MTQPQKMYKLIGVKPQVNYCADNYNLRCDKNKLGAEPEACLSCKKLDPLYPTLTAEKVLGIEKVIGLFQFTNSNLECCYSIPREEGYWQHIFGETRQEALAALVCELPEVHSQVKELFK